MDNLPVARPSQGSEAKPSGEVNVYDFDGTIYSGDSTLDFYLSCLKLRPWLAPRALPAVALAPLALAGVVSRERFKEAFYRSFLPHVADIENEVAAFWEEAVGRIADWYLDRKHPTDIIISASPEFLLQPMTDFLGVRLIASKVDPRSGALLGPNCRANEKVVRLRAEFGEIRIDNFYTDTDSDAPLAALAQRAWRVERKEISEFRL